jgi:hypothetical protein|tara:strand:+ start:1957 stop:2214 length:258 start_codon:yes stop_codon:yes gene_type:complete
VGKHRRTDYSRLSLEEIEAIRPELEDTYKAYNDSYAYTTVANRYNIEPGILMLLMSDCWKDFKIYYEGNSLSGLYKKFLEYRDTL